MCWTAYVLDRLCTEGAYVRPLSTAPLCTAAYVLLLMYCCLCTEAAYVHSRLRAEALMY